HHGPVHFGVHPALGDIAVGADADVKKTSIRAGSERLGPVVVNRGGQVGDLDWRTAGAGLAILIIESHQCVLIGDVKNVVNQSEPVGRVEVFGEDGLQFIAAIAVAVAQQGQAVAALYIRTAFGLYAAGDHIFGFQLGRTAAPAFGNENVAVGEDQCLARDIE